MDEIEEELDHQEFMSELRKLQEEITLAWLDRPVHVIMPQYNDIVRYGNEPIFTSIIFDRMVAENELQRSNSTAEISD